MNSVQLVARLAADPDHRDTDKGTVTNMRVAVTRPRGRDGEDRGADYIDIAVWGTQAQACATYLAKGRLVGIGGRLHHREWTAEDGTKRSRLQVLADSVEFLDAPRNGNGAASSEKSAA